MKKVYAIIIVFGLAVLLNKSYAAIDIYMKVIDENGVQINGESQATNFVNWIEIGSLADGSDNNFVYNASTGGATPNRAVAAPFNFQMTLNNAALSLLKRVYSGRLLRTVDIYFVTNSVPCNCPFYKIHMENVVVKSFEEAASANASIDQQFSFVPLKFAWAYYKQANGTIPTTPTVRFGWDLATNAEFVYAF